MSRTITSRLATAGFLTLATGTAGLVLAPSASAAEAPAVTLSATSVAPGEEFTISGEDCISPDDAEYEALVLVLSEEGDIYEEVEPAVDGSWSVTTAFPDDVAAGEQLMVAGCDWYTDGWAYGEWTMTVEGSTSGDIRGVEANTPGTKAKTSDKTTSSAAPGQKVVRIIEGFQPHEWVTLYMHSTKTEIGRFQADADGVVTAEFTLPAGTTAGTHTLVYEGAMGTYFQESFTVAAAGKQLAYTGADVTVPLSLGVGLVLAGAGALVVSRRRTAGAAQI